MTTPAGEIGEFKVLYGFTRDCERIGGGALEYRGLVKVLPQAVGIYRTGDRWGLLLTFARMFLRQHSYPWADEIEPSRPADVAPNTDGIPEHVIDARRMTLLHDTERHLVILQVPGTTHFVLKPRRQGFASVEETERDLLAALERCTRARAQPVACRRDYLSSLPIPAVVLVVAIIVFILLAVVLHFTS